MRFAPGGPSARSPGNGVRSCRKVVQWFMTAVIVVVSELSWCPRVRHSAANQFCSTDSRASIVRW